MRAHTVCVMWCTLRMSTLRMSTLHFLVALGHLYFAGCLPHALSYVWKTSTTGDGSAGVRRRDQDPDAAGALGARDEESASAALRGRQNRAQRGGSAKAEKAAG